MYHAISDFFYSTYYILLITVYMNSIDFLRENFERPETIFFFSLCLFCLYLILDSIQPWFFALNHVSRWCRFRILRHICITLPLPHIFLFELKLSYLLYNFCTYFYFHSYLVIYLCFVFAKKFKSLNLSRWTGTLLQKSCRTTDSSSRCSQARSFLSSPATTLQF